MQFKTTEINATYEVTFSSRLFGIVTRRAELLQELEQKISPRFTVNSNDLRGYGGASLADMKVRVILFNGAGQIDITADTLTATFARAVSRDDLVTIKDCISLALDALSAWAPTCSVSSEVLKLTLTSELTDGQTTAELIASVVKVSHNFDPKEYGCASAHRGFRMEFDDLEQKRRVSFDLVRSWASPTGFLCIGNANYYGGTKFNNFAERLDFLSAGYARFLQDCDLKSIHESTITKE